VYTISLPSAQPTTPRERTRHGISGRPALVVWAIHPPLMRCSPFRSLSMSNAQSRFIGPPKKG
jgi:hypothetical protein